MKVNRHGLNRSMCQECGLQLPFHKAKRSMVATSFSELPEIDINREDVWVCDDCLVVMGGSVDGITNYKIRSHPRQEAWRNRNELL